MDDEIAPRGSLELLCRYCDEGGTCRSQTTQHHPQTGDAVSTGELEVVMVKGRAPVVGSFAFINHDDANQFLRREYRKSWEI